jgi:phosphate acyltransferase
MATAKVVLGAVAGVDRPALAAVFPTAPGNPAMLLDVGANVDCKPQNLEQFAVMGDIYFRAMFGKRFGFRPAQGPRVGLLSIGEEETKGNELTREAFHSVEAVAAELRRQCGRPRPVQRQGRRDCGRRICGQRRAEDFRRRRQPGAHGVEESLKATITRQVGALLSRSASSISRSASTTPNTAARRCWA